MAVLAASLVQAVGIKPVFISAEHYLPPLRAAARAAGVIILDRLEPAYRSVGCVEPFPIEPAQAEARAQELLEQYKPTSVNASEVLGPNRRGVIHSRTGGDYSNDNPKLHVLVNRARASGAFTMAFGDGGNEVGMGVIEPAVREWIPYGDECRCPCGDGIADTTEVDHLVVANISDWCAYGVAACLSSALRRDLLPTSEELRDVIKAAVQAGAVDGVTCRALPHVDGTELETQVALLQLLRQIATNSYREVHRPY